MDVTTLRIAATLACFAVFVGIMFWAFASHNKGRFEEAAQLPFKQD